MGCWSIVEDGPFEGFIVGKVFWRKEGFGFMDASDFIVCYVRLWFGFIAGFFLYVRGF